MHVHKQDISLSVVIYRDYKTPLQMIHSLSEHKPSNLCIHLYVVDNSNLGSEDSLLPERATFCCELESTSFAEYINPKENLGFGKANNLALMLANSTYHAFVNPDIVFRDDALTALKDFMDETPEAGMCIPRIVDANGELQQVYWQEPSVLDAFNRMFMKNAMKKRARYYTMSGADYTKPFQVPFGQGSFLFGRTQLLQELGGFDDSYFMYLEDADLCHRINECSKFFYCPDATVVHNWEKGSHKDSHLFKIHIQSYAKYFCKWGLRLL